MCYSHRMKRLFLSVALSMLAYGCGDDISDSPISDRYDCEGNGAIGSCDAIACGFEANYQGLKLVCAASLSADCDALARCADGYARCFVDTCPSGTAFGEANGEAVERCSDDYEACVSDAGL